jgi:hypothetical protein
MTGNGNDFDIPAQVDSAGHNAAPEVRHAGMQASICYGATKQNGPERGRLLSAVDQARLVVAGRAFTGR